METKNQSNAGNNAGVSGDAPAGVDNNTGGGVATATKPQSMEQLVAARYGLADDAGGSADIQEVIDNSQADDVADDSQAQDAGEGQDAGDNSQANDAAEGQESDDASGEASDDAGEEPWTPERVEAYVQEKTAETAKNLERVQADYEALLAEKIVPVTQASDALAYVSDVQTLNNFQKQAMAIRRWCNSHPDGGACDLMRDAKGNPIEVDSERVRQLLVQTDDDLMVNIPERREWLAAQEHVNRAIEKELPILNNKSHELTMAANRIVARHPEIKNSPNWRARAAAQALGEILIRSHGAKAWDIVSGAKPSNKASTAKDDKKATPNKVATATGKGVNGGAVVRKPVPAVRHTQTAPKSPGQNTALQKAKNRESLSRGELESVVANKYGLK